MITTVTLGHLLVGMALGTRFRVAVLAPAMLVSVLTVTTVAAALGGGCAWSAAAVIAAIGTLQIGFLAGAALRDRMTGPLPSLVAVRAGR